MLRIPYKAYPASEEESQRGKKYSWWPVLTIRLTDRRVQVKTKSFQAVVDSGSDDCLFHADFLRPFHVILTDGTKGTLGGVGRATAIPVYFHPIHILIGADYKISVNAGFSDELSVAGILGRNGFFDCFKVTFDHTENTPMLELTKIDRKQIQ